MEDWAYVSDPLQFSKLLQLLNNQLCQDSNVSIFLKAHKKQSKMVNVNYGKEQKTKKQTNKQKEKLEKQKKLCISYNCTIIHTHSHISQTRVVTNKL